MGGGDLIEKVGMMGLYFSPRISAYVLSHILLLLVIRRPSLRQGVREEDYSSELSELENPPREPFQHAD